MAQRLVLRYAAFAAAATLLNLGVQWLSFLVYDGPLALYLAMTAGTGSGLIFKFLLDRKWIFFQKPESAAKGLRRFFMYTLMGVATTVLFWGTEILFDALLPHAWARYLGGAIGLVLGYTAKFFLDRRFVFDVGQGDGIRLQRSDGE